MSIFYVLNSSQSLRTLCQFMFIVFLKTLYTHIQLEWHALYEIEMASQLISDLIIQKHEQENNILNLNQKQHFRILPFLRTLFVLVKEHVSAFECSFILQIAIDQFWEGARLSADSNQSVTSQDSISSPDVSWD